MAVSYLGYEIDSSGAVVATQNLDKMTDAAIRSERAENVLSNTTKSTSSSVKSMSTAVDVLSRELSSTAQSATIAKTSLAGIGAELVSTQREAALYRAEMDAIRAQFNPLFAASKQYEAQLQSVSNAERLGAISANEAADARRSASAALGHQNAAMMQSKAAFDSLRASMDPMFAASKAYEAQLEIIESAERSGAVSAQAAAAAKTRAASVLSGATANMNKYGAATVVSTAHTANLGAQLNDIGVMLAAGQSPLQLAVQQGTQINQVFAQMGGGTAALRGLAAGFMSMVNPMSLATIGIIAGGAALVQWGMSALSAGEDTEEFTRRLEDTLEAQRALNDEIRGFRLGVSGDELVLLDAISAKRAEIAEMQRNITPQTRIQIEAEKDALDVLLDQLATQRRLEAEKDRMVAATRDLSDAEREVGNQMQFTARQIAESEAITRLLRDGMSASAIAALRLAGVDIASGISSAADEAARLADNLNISLLDAINLKNLQDSLVFSGRGGDPSKFGDPFKRDPNEGTGALSSGAQSLIDAANRRSSRGSGARRGGGGRVKEDPYQADLQALIESLRTERETIDAWYMESDALLNDRRATELLSAQEHNAAKLALESEYQERLSGIRGAYQGSALDQTQQFMGEMAAALQGGNDKMQRIAQTFASIEALINAYRAYNQVIADPTLPWYAKIPAAAGVLAAGMKTVQSIKSLSGGGGGSGGGSASSAPSAQTQAPQQQQRAIIQINGNRSRFTIDEINDIIMQLQKEAKDGVIIEGFVAT